MTEHTIRPEPLTADAFGPFGQVISREGAHHYAINNGMTERYHDLASIELAGPKPRPLISILQGKPYFLPLSLRMVERHPLGSQAFYPLGNTPWLVIVAQDSGGTPAKPRVFSPAPGQGVNIAINTWHGVLTPLEQEAGFLVVDRGGEGVNLQEHFFDTPWLIEA